MPIPSSQKEIHLPYLEIMRDGRERHLSEIAGQLADRFDLTDVERNERYTKSKRLKFYNYIEWASYILKEKGLLCRPQPGCYQITELGLKESEAGFDDEAQETPIPEKPPIQLIEENIELLREQLANDLLERILNCKPHFFERLVVYLMEMMEYGTGMVTVGSGDGGIDGIIEEDKLGLNKIYLQAKLYAPENKVGSKDIQAFKGSMDDQNANKGVFITTSGFSKPAIESARKGSVKSVVLIDGQKLVELMIDHDVGVSTQTTWTLKRIDRDYFDPEY